MPAFLWTQRSNFGPRPRVYHSMAYDSKRGRVVMFGGQIGDASRLSDTWEWDGAYRTQMQDTGPSPRSHHAMVYDDARQVTVLFGGDPGGGGFLGDTWQWDGQNWTQISDSGPAPRRSHAMAFDSARSRTVLFSGEAAAGALQDTWEFDGQDWTEQEDTGPSARTGHAMTFHGSISCVILFGGSPGLADTWAWDGNTWAQVAEFGPQGRSMAAMTWMGDGSLLYGGYDSQNLFGDSWQFDGKLWTERQDMGPGARFGHALVFDINRSRLVLHGGQSTAIEESNPPGLFGDTWEHQEDQPSPSPSPSPGPVSVSSLVLSPDSGHLGDSVKASITLSGPAPANGVTVKMFLAPPPTPDMFLVQTYALPDVNISSGQTKSETYFMIPLLGGPHPTPWLLGVAAWILGTPPPPVSSGAVFTVTS